MYKLTFANGTEFEVLDGVLSGQDNTLGEQCDAFSFMVRIVDISYSDLFALLSLPENLERIILTNDSYPNPIRESDDEPEFIPVSEAYVGYVRPISITYRQHILTQGLLGVPPVFEWVYEVMLAEQTNGQYQARAVAALLNRVNDDEAEGYLDAFPLWSTMGMFDGMYYTGSYIKGDRVRHRELLYRCIKNHAIHPSQELWNPADSPDLWKLISHPAEEWPEWVQPQGAHDAYDIGAKVTHSNRRWVSTFNGANVWEPGVVGSNIWEEAY